MLGSAGCQRFRLVLVVFAAMLSVAACVDQPDTNLARDSGRGWRLLGYEREAATSSLAAIVTNDRSLDVAWAEGSFSTAKPVLDFTNDVGLILTPGVSGSCPDIVFEDLLIGEDEVFAAFDYPSPPLFRGCTADFNPISFFFTVDRAALPDQFTLAVTEDSFCFTCRMEVDMTDEASVEAELWGGRFTVEAEGTAPGENHVNVVRMITSDGNVGAFLFQPGDWHRPDSRDRDMGSLRSIERVEGFLSACEGQLCIEDACDVADCNGLQPMGEVCSMSPELKVEPQTLTVTFNGEDCTMEIRVTTER